MDSDLPLSIRLLKLLETDVLDVETAVRWADTQIGAGPDVPPEWLCDLAIAKSKLSGIQAARLFAYRTPDRNETSHKKEHEYQVACMFVRSDSTPLAWASFLRSAGEWSDGVNGHLGCEYFYMLLNELEQSIQPGQLATRQHAAVAGRFREAIAMVQKDVRSFGGE